jgi:hypothetical protein
MDALHTTPLVMQIPGMSRQVLGVGQKLLSDEAERASGLLILCIHKWSDGEGRHFVAARYT